jgi:branched-chain amino acid aminotransferase
MEPDYTAGCAFTMGQYVPVKDAHISILDMGFSRSDCTYDVVAVWDGGFFRLDDHLARFARSCECLQLHTDHTLGEIATILTECVRRSGLREAYVEMIMTRGVPQAGERDPRRITNRFHAYAIPYVWIANADQRARGLHLVVARSVERISSRAIDPTVKNFHWGDLVRGLFEAYERNADTAVLVDANGYLTEGPGFNVFAFYRGQLITPADGALHGITRQTVLDLAAQAGVTARVGRVEPDMLAQASEIFVTSTAGGVMPVTLLDGQPVGDGTPGPLTQRLCELYWQAHRAGEWVTPVDYRAPRLAKQ